MSESTPGTRTSRRADRHPPSDEAGSEAKNFLWQTITEDLRARIHAGDLAPGQLVPSESELAARYTTSRPTVRKAVAALRSAGLVVTEHGRGTLVASRPTSTLLWNPTIVHEPMPATEFGAVFTTWDKAPTWTVTGTPQTYQTLIHHHADLMKTSPGTPVFVLERRLLHQPTSTQILQRIHIPFTIASTVPSLSADPFQAPADLYQILSAAGYTLNWSDTLQAEMPTPDDTASQPIPEGVPVLVHLRITRAADDTPLALEEARLPADRATIRTRPVQ